jgi:hypothetical protein
MTRDQGDQVWFIAVLSATPLRLVCQGSLAASAMGSQ